MDDPSDKGHALRWLRAQSQPDKRDFIVALAESNLLLTLEAVQRVELRGDCLIAALKPCFDADISTLRRWLTPVLRMLGTDRYLQLIEELIDENPPRACRAMWWLGPQLHHLGLDHYHRRSLDELQRKFATVDRPDDMMDWAWGRGNGMGDAPVT